MTARTTAPASSPTAAVSGGRSEIAHIAELYRRESERTLRVIRAYPPDEASMQPHESANSALRLLHTFTVENTLLERAVRGEMGTSREMPPMPGSWADGIAAYEAGVERVRGLLAAMSEEDFAGTVPFFTAPKTMGEYSMRDFLELMIHDSIHHRGQLSVYLRMTGSKVPAIYGPSKDEPWN